MYHYPNLKLYTVNSRTFAATHPVTNDDPAVFSLYVTSFFFFCPHVIYISHLVYTAGLDFPFDISCHVGRTDVSHSFNACFCHVCLPVTRLMRYTDVFQVLLFVLVAVARGNRGAVYVARITLIADNKQPRRVLLSFSFLFTLFSACVS
jgi:hypothetical protein